MKMETKKQSIDNKSGIIHDSPLLTMDSLIPVNKSQVLYSSIVLSWWIGLTR